MTRTAEVTSKIMRAVRNADTGPELTLRRALHARGMRYRVRNGLFGRPDLVFPGARVAVFVDGDHWHGHAWSVRGFESFDAYYGRGPNGAFWLEKITRNVARDQYVTARLEADGWTVLRIWESDIQRDPPAVVGRVQAAVEQPWRDDRRIA
jgi:DNA mismatch endonuclease (patch repair protein)